MDIMALKFVVIATMIFMIRDYCYLKQTHGKAVSLEKLTEQMERLIDVQDDIKEHQQASGLSLRAGNVLSEETSIQLKKIAKSLEPGK